MYDNTIKVDKSTLSFPFFKKKREYFIFIILCNKLMKHIYC